jgi:neural Wiskott-Aldrich syndrome protein
MQSFQGSTIQPPGSFGFGGPQYPYSPTSLADSVGTMSLNDPYAAPLANSGFYPQPSHFSGALYQPLPPAGGFGPPQPSVTPIPSGFQPMYTGFVPPRPAPTPIPAFIQPPPSSMGFHQHYPPQPPLQQHHPFPSAVPTPAPSGFGPLPLHAGPPQLQYAPTPTPAPYPVTVPQQLSGFQGTCAPGGRPLPEQPQSSGFTPIASQPPIAFPSPAVQYHPTPVPIPPVAPGFVAPGPPPPLRQPQQQQQQQQQVPPQQPSAVQSSPAHSVQPLTYHPNPPPPLPIPPQQPQFAQNGHVQNGAYTYTQPGPPPFTPNTTNPFPPLPNPPSHPNFPQSQSPQQIWTQLPGPPPPLPKKGNTGSHPLPAPPPLQPWQQRPANVSEQIQQQHQQQSVNYAPSANGVQPPYLPPPAVQGHW